VRAVANVRHTKAFLLQLTPRDLVQQKSPSRRDLEPFADSGGKGLSRNLFGKLVCMD
jgi:hypothetical protein